MAGDSWPLAELFDALVDLPAEEQRARLAELPEAQRAELERLLALDAGSTRQPEDPLGRVVADVLEVAAQEVREGARIGPWRVLRELGAGGMGTVLLAERADWRPAEWVASKAAPLINKALTGELAKYRAVKVEEVAAAMIELAAGRTPGAHLHHLPLRT